MRRMWLTAVLGPLLVACATTPPVPLGTACEQGDAWACDSLGGALLQQGERESADAAFGRACEDGILSACRAQARMRMEAGDLVGAEPPLLRAYEAADEEGTLVLADLHEARGGAEGLEAAARLRREAPALDKPAFEFVASYRMDVSNGLGSDVTLNIQPLGMMERRLTFGANVAFISAGASELNGFVGYQHFVSSWLVPYGRVMLGAALDAAPGQNGPNIGAEVGAKLCLGSIGHLNLAAGSSRASPGYVSMGLGLDGLIVLIAAAHAL
ncbi:hypothetical protein [Pyxidicoccus xibeiensis]|uniref:hypothetical protein n=1 Tax=Pyxidicoccus xibeiensis TaxID=2906759 RepID=UPI0020A7EF98|nr:hypothetical protein [Pyxidicoccus xibeiensis]MCP3140863.1 hypothetical protein [Pyxidicoccus xibeiensis]